MKINQKIYKIIAMGIIILSLVLYIIMPLNICLPFSTCAVAGITGSMIIASEILFWIGSLMIGRDIALKIKKKLSVTRILNYLRERKKEK
jgi:xanthosine utilization system XapX-like protein